MSTVLDRRVDGVRRFNRFYTKRIGVLAENFLRSPYTLAEGRVLFELANRERPSPSDIAAALDLDPGYLSRILRRFERAGLVTRAASPADGRRIVLTLTRRRRAAYAPLNERSHDDIAALLAPLPDDRQERVLNAMATIAQALASGRAGQRYRSARPWPRRLRLGDRKARRALRRRVRLRCHMEGFVSEVIAAYVANFRAGSRSLLDCRAQRRRVAVASSSSTTRITTIGATAFAAYRTVRSAAAVSGRRLVRECIAFARAAGYRKMILWTHSILTAARAIYASEGFVMIGNRVQRPLGPAPHQRNVGTLTAVVTASALAVAAPNAVLSKMHHTGTGAASNAGNDGGETRIVIRGVIHARRSVQAPILKFGRSARRERCSGRGRIGSDASNARCCERLVDRAGKPALVARLARDAARVARAQLAQRILATTPWSYANDGGN